MLSTSDAADQKAGYIHEHELVNSNLESNNVLLMEAAENKVNGCDSIGEQGKRVQSTWANRKSEQLPCSQ